MINPVTSLFGAEASADRAVGEFTAADTGNGTFVIQRANEAFVRQFEAEQRQVIGQPIGAVVSGPLGFNLARCVEECGLKGRLLTRRLQKRAKPRSQWFVLIVVPRRVEPGSQFAREVAGTVADVTDLASADDFKGRVPDLDLYLTHGVDSAQEPMLVCDVKDENAPIVHVNGAFCRLFQYTFQEVVGRDPFFMLFPRRGEEVAPSIHAILRGEAQPLPIVECFGNEGRRLMCRVVAHFHGDPQQHGLLRLTFLTVDPMTAGQTQTLTERQRQRMELDTLIAACGSIINDFNNLLAIVQTHQSLMAEAGVDVAQSVRQAKAKATDAADQICQVLSATSMRLADSHRAASGGVPGFLQAAAPAPAPLPPQAPLAQPPQPPPRPGPQPGPHAAPQSPFAHQHPAPQAQHGHSPFAQQAPARPQPQPQPANVGHGAPQAGAGQGNRPGVHRGLRKVLVVDDEPALLQIVTAMLTPQGYELTLASTGGEAMNLLGILQPLDHPPDFNLILLDLQLPDMNGMHLLDLVRPMGITCPILVMSGYISKQVMDQINTKRWVSVVQKPFTQEQLLAACDKMLKL